MKRFLLFLAVVALVLPAVPRVQADDVSVDFFYNNLSDGSWIEVGDYGYCWQPDVAANDPNWRPYSDGYWTYTDLGWTWVSYEDFGWATYHYGRWARLSDLGWIWVPGSDGELEWGPAWVSWRTGGDYVGWAPLPPRGHAVYDNRPITGRVDIEFDIGPSCYNFIDVRYIGEPVLRERIIARSQNVTYINETVNVTNITYKNKAVYNYGPDFHVLSGRSNRPIQQLKLERKSNVDFSAAAKSSAMTKVEGDKLVVGAPLTIEKSVKHVAPPTVKVKVAQAHLDHGWSGSDPKAEEQLKKKMQGEDSKKIPPATGRANRATSNASPAASVSPATVTSPVGSTIPATSASPAVSVSPFGKGKRNFDAQTQPHVSGAPAATSSASPVTIPLNKVRRGQLQNIPASSATATIVPDSTPFEKSKPTFEHKNLKPLSSPSPSGNTSTELPQNRFRTKQIEPAVISNTGSPQSTETGPGPRRKVEGTSIPSTNAPSTAATIAPVEHGQGRLQGGKGKKAESVSPSPSP